MNREVVLFVATIVHACALLMGMAAGQSRDENVARCDGSDSDLQIASCTALIQSGQGGTEFLAKAFRRRGNAYDAKGEYDRAIQDFDQAIRLKPNYDEAFTNRG